MKVVRKKPRELSPSWPEVPSPDNVGEVARRFALSLRDAIGTRSVRAVAADCEVSHATVSHILAGEIYVDVASLARLEYGLRADLWPGRRGASVAV